ncbi:MAG: class I SAM-dependent methyltransferase [Clostridium sp.]|nr:class I SAM-dependent methyltransferase [Clostridium sp.]
MAEQIGKVKLDETYYGGEDLYCDGAVEDTLLAIARDHAAEEFPRIIEEQKSWPVLYHLSRFRENIVSFLPITKSSRVLEIGAGCGAITGALAARAGSVTCVDLSKKRSMINAYRHRESGNITIKIGNFKDMEPSLESDYDFVLLIGVFEYGQGYMDTETPYEDFLKIIRRHCAPDGRIVIAIENKYGLKYFAGCKEDHVGDYFTGLEDYPGGGSVRTFGRDGLIRVMERCGVRDYHFYYPYPDYKFMTALYSDAYLPRVGELTNNMRNFDRERMVLFDEKNVYDGLIREGRFAEFANSFLIVIGEPLRQVYVKYSNDRAPQYAIRTDICVSEGVRYVEKRPDTPEACAHIRNLLQSYEQLSRKYEGSGLSINTCEAAGDGVRFAYVAGGTLEEALDECLYRDDEEGFLALLARYEEIASYHADMPVSDYDLIFANILIGAQGWTLIDYEWTVPEAMDGEMLGKRAMFVYASGPEFRRRWLFARGIAQRYGITPENLARLQRGENEFQERVMDGRRSMAQLYEQMGQPATPVRDLVLADQAMEPFRRFQVYVDTGEGFSEEQSFFMPHVYQDRSRVNVRIPFAKEVRALRLDPALVPCMLYGIKICVNGRCVYEQTTLSARAAEAAASGSGVENAAGARGTANADMTAAGAASAGMTAAGTANTGMAAAEAQREGAGLVKTAPDCQISMNGIAAPGGAEVFPTNDPNLTVFLDGVERAEENELTMEAGIIFLTDEAAKSLYPSCPEAPEPKENDGGRAGRRKRFWKL